MEDIEKKYHFFSAQLVSAQVLSAKLSETENIRLFLDFCVCSFCRPTPRRIVQLLFGILKALCEISTGAGNFVPGFFCPLSAVSIQFFECFFFSIFF